jgi:pimeloyl-ACP methyl ester carboxylesterase
MRLVLGLSGFVSIAALSGATYQWIATRRDLASAPPPGTFVDVGGYRLHLWCTGAGAPTVILDSGLGGTSAGWGFVQPEVARFTRVCSYDRAGMGYSDPGPSPRTARRLASELATLVDRSGIDKPLVLVGASSGGFNVRVFAADYPDRVAGLVLVDATHEDQPHEIPHIARFAPLLASTGILRLLGFSLGHSVETLAPSVQQFARATRFRTAGYRAAAAEIMVIRENAAEVKSSRRKLMLPMVVVTGGLGADRSWRDLQRDQVTLSDYGCQIVAEESGHVVPVDQPGVVVDAIRATVNIAKGRKLAVPCGSRSAR